MFDGMITRSNRFKVLNEERYAQLFRKLSTYSNEPVEDEVTTTDDGSIVHRFWANEDVIFTEEENSNNLLPLEEGWLQELQKILPDGEAVIIIRTAFESTEDSSQAYDNSYYSIITRDHIRHGDINGAAIDVAKQMLDNPNWNTTIEF